MAQSLYDISPSQSVQYNNNTSNPMHSPSLKFSQLHHNMSNARNAPNQKSSRLELLRINFNKKLQMEQEAKINQLRLIQQQYNPKKGSNSGGLVREFFAERRALEASRGGQKNPELLPPIDTHFRKLKEQKQEISPQGQYYGLLSKTFLQARKNDLQHETQSQEKTLPSKYSAQMKSNYGVGYSVRKRTKGVDKQDPLPPVKKYSSKSKNKKPPTPNKRYETHPVLIQDHNTLKIAEQSVGYLPAPEAITKKPHTKWSTRAPLPPSSSEAFSDLEDTQSTHSVLSDNSNVVPDLTSLKAKALRQRQFSKQRLMSSGVLRDNTRTVDFHKWQIEQDKEQENRHKKDSGKIDQSRSQRENDLLKKIEEEEKRLQKLQRQREELEEEERKQREEDMKWLSQKSTFKETSKIPRQDSIQDSTHTEAAKAAKSHRQPLKQKSQVHQQKLLTETDFVENKIIHDNPYHDFYAGQTKDLQDVTLIDLARCSICGRNFATERLDKHEKVCVKNTTSKRKAFDSRKQRNLGTDAEKYVKSGKYLEEPKKKPKVDWRAQHENFIKTIRYAKGVSDEPPPPTENPDYIQCPHCQRKFNPSAAERHIPRCKDIKARPAPPKRK